MIQLNFLKGIMEKIGNNQSNYLRSFGSRILCELNDLKRSPATVADELGYSLEHVNSILDGQALESDYHEFINRMGRIYPVDHLQLCLLKDDTINGITYVSANQSEKSKRVYTRIDRNKKQSEYYEYRDTAMSKLALFKPEWIAVLREVENSDPNNSDVVMNKGHFMHQITLFIGPVNFYYEDSNGKMICCEMNTGDSNYITPFVKHSFASRDKDSFTCILAVTFGESVSRAQRNLYALGIDALDSYTLSKNPRIATRQLIRQWMNNNLLTESSLDSIIKKRKSNIDIREILSTTRKITNEECDVIASCLNVGTSDIIVPDNISPKDCVLKYISNTEPHDILGETDRYKVYTLAQPENMPSVRSSILEVRTKEQNMEQPLQKSLHTYIINFDKHPVELKWEHENKLYSKVLDQNDSVYLKPFVKFSFANTNEDKSRLLIVGISTAVSISAQKELSTFIEPRRTINELETWYDC